MTLKMRENIYEKLNENINKSQKFKSFHDVETTQSKTNSLNKIFVEIQLSNYL